METPRKRKSFQAISWPDSCPLLVLKLNELLTRHIDGPFTFEQLRTLDSLKLLVDQLRRCDAPFLIFSLLWCKLDFATKASEDETSLDCARGYACEIAAMRLLRKYNSHEVLTALTNDYKASAEADVTGNNQQDLVEVGSGKPLTTPDDRTPLLRVDSPSTSQVNGQPSDIEAIQRSKQRIGGDTFTALEVAIIAEAKHFTSAHIVQQVLNDIWTGNVVFWNKITESETKKASYYNKDKDGEFWNFARLRVPQYSFMIESLNFFILAALYLVVVIDREYSDLGWIEGLLAIWFIGFTYQEYDQFREAGAAAFYLANPFNYFDLGMIAVALTWIVLRTVGIAKQDPYILGRSYDVLSLQGVLLVPRLFTFLSLSPWFGTLFPCLRRLVVDFMKFLVLIIALFTGFVVSFSVLGRNVMSVNEVTWLLIRVFFGGSGMGFDAMHSLHPLFGPPLMIIFVTFSQILLTTALISILSNSFSMVMNNARSEYHFLFATTCLEASKSDHMVILSPPFNLMGLLIIRPLRLFLPSNHIVLRTIKIWILKVTHAPYMLLISLYERSSLAPIMSEAQRRRLDKASRHPPLLMNRPLSGLQRLVPGMLGPAGVLGIVGDTRRNEIDSDDEDGVDTGVMISDNSTSLDDATKQKLDDLSKQIDEMKDMMASLVAQANRA